MARKLYRIAAVLSLVIGLMAVIAGGQVLMGKVMDYYVIDWLPVYNFSLGLFSALVMSVLLWRQSAKALSLALGTLGVHAGVMIVLLTAYRSVVAPDSLAAMTIRITVWVIILALLAYARRQGRPVAA
jgi:cell shape-determining protein MreD